MKWAVLVGCLALGPGCGLLLDYDPPSDGGVDAPGLDVPMDRDAATDAGECSCRPPEMCTRLGCRLPCNRPADCMGDPARCETCGPGGFCAPIICPSSACETRECNPLTDRCDLMSTTCLPDEVCVGDLCQPGATCTLGTDCMDVDVCDERFECREGVCRPRIRLCSGECGDECCRADSTRCPADRPFCLDPELRCVGCTGGGDCSTGICSAELDTCTECDSLNPCTVGTCDPSGACVDSCGPGRPCTPPLVCAGGTCQLPCSPGVTFCTEEICGNGRDDDGDGLTDEDCAPCAFGPVSCAFSSGCCMTSSNPEVIGRLYTCSGTSCFTPIAGDPWILAPTCPGPSPGTDVIALRGLTGRRELVSIACDLAAATCTVTNGSITDRLTLPAPRTCDSSLAVPTVTWDLSVGIVIDRSA